MSHNRNYQETYESILGEILAGREATQDVVDGVFTGQAYGKELREYHEQLKGVDTTQAGWVDRLLGRKR